MTDSPTRVVDAHVHLWDPARTDWYPYLSGGRSSDMGDVTGMARRFDVPTYRAESAGWNVEKLVNVAAATGRHSIDETLELDRRAEVDGHPDAIVGGIPPTDSVAEAVELLDRQMAAVPLPGRPADGRRPTDRSRPPRCSARSQERGLRVRADGPPRPARRRRPRGWPASTTWSSSSSTPAGRGRDADEERALWKAGMRRARRARRARRLQAVRAWRCRSGRWRRTRSPRGSSTPSRRSASTGACSPATSPSTACTAPSTSSTPRYDDGDRRPRRRVPRQALRHQRRAHLPLLSHRHRS